MNIPSYALTLEFDPDSQRWYMPLEEGARVWFDSYEEGIAQLSELMQEAKAIEQASLPRLLDDSSAR
jgi:hypothetical protein